MHRLTPWPWLTACVAVLGGIGVQLQQAHLAPPWAWVVALGLGAGLMVLAWGLSRGRDRARWAGTAREPRRPEVAPLSFSRVQSLLGGLVGCLAWGLVSWAAVEARAQARWAERDLGDAWPVLTTRAVWLTGQVDELPQVSEHGLRWVVRVADWQLRGPGLPMPHPDEAATLTAPLGRRVMLFAARSEGEWGAAAWPPLRVGQWGRWRVQLRQPQGLSNPGGFDTALWLWSQDIVAQGSVRAWADADPQVVAQSPPGWTVRWCQAWEAQRQRWRDRLRSQGHDSSATGVLAALLVGDQGSLAPDDWRVFQRTGTAHLMAISGLHITMLAWLATAGVGAAWRRWSWGRQRWPAPTVAAWAGVAVAAVYALFAGWGAPAQRTVWMLATVVALRSGARRWPGALVWGVAAVVVVCVDPWSLLQPGLILSFVAVGSLMWLDSRVPPGTPPVPLWRQAVRAQWVTAWALLPWTLLVFGQVSLVGLLANALAVPVVTWGVTPLVMLGAGLEACGLPGAGGVWIVAEALVQGLLGGLRLLAVWPLGWWWVPQPPWWAWVAAALGAAVAVMPLPRLWRVSALLLVLPLLWPTQSGSGAPAWGQLRLSVLDVGQGTAVLLRTAEHSLLFDAGPRWGPVSSGGGADAGSRVIVPALRALGVRRLDRLVLSHSDTDHIGGAASVMQDLPVTLLHTSLAASHPLRAGSTPHEPCRAGQAWSWDGVDFRVLHPLAQVLASGASAPRPNALSCVIRVEDRSGRRLLLTGDIEAEQEAQLRQREGPGLRAQGLIAPHHGSQTSSTPPFLQAVAPEVVWVQVGAHNRYGHPAPVVMQRYEGLGLQVLSSVDCGAWIGPLPAGSSWTDGCERHRRPRYWHALLFVP